MKTHYELLEIEPTASQEDIRASYLRAVAFYHPGRNKSKDAIEMTQLVNEAYEILKDPVKRIRYDYQDLVTEKPKEKPSQEPELARQEPEPRWEQEVSRGGFWGTILIVMIILIIGFVVYELILRMF